LARWTFASQPGGRRSAGASNRLATLLNDALVAIKSFNAAGLEQTLNRASTKLSMSAFLWQNRGAVDRAIGIYWQSGQIEAIQEHLATAVIRTSWEIYCTIKP
jgi:hypothetical protein